MVSLITFSSLSLYIYLYLVLHCELIMYIHVCVPYVCVAATFRLGIDFLSLTALRSIFVNYTYVYNSTDKTIKVHSLEDNQLLRSSHVSNLVSVHVCMYMYCICKISNFDRQV